MRLPAFVVVSVVALGCGPEAFLPVGPRVDGLHELSHTVSVRFEAGAALLRVVRQVRNDGESVATVADHRVLLPEGAIATALRLGRNGALPQAAVLATTEAVADRWARLTGAGNGAPAPIGKLEWVNDGELALDLFGLLPRETVTVAYDVLVPPRYEQGALVFEFPREAAGDRWLPPRFERADAEETERAFIVRHQHHTGPVADVRWGTSQLDVERTLWRLEVDAALELEPAPVAPRVVFVVDASHSEGPRGIAAQLELVAPYLLNTPDALVEVVLFRRFAERLFGRFVPVRDVAGLLASTPAPRLSPGNGSNLELGAALAARALAEVGGPARVVLFTDEALPNGFSIAGAVAALQGAPAGTVAHVVSRDASRDGALEERRVDEGPLSTLAAATGGVFLRVDGSPVPIADAAATLRGLVRPVRVDDFHVEAPGLPALDLDPTLDEGEMVRLQGVDARPPSRLVVTGKVWAQEFRREVEVDAALSSRLPGLAVGSEGLRLLLTDDELRSAAFLAQAVSPVTSFFFAPPAATPSTAGQDDGVMLRGFLLHGLGCGGWGSSSRCGGVFVRAPVDHLALLRELLAPGVAACEARSGESVEGALELEATGDEVVAVEVTAPTATLRECLTEAAWALRLGPQFVSHRTYSVHLAPR